MKNEISTDCGTYCEKGYGGRNKCKYLDNTHSCTLYDTKLKSDTFANMNTGRDEMCVIRCKQCKEEN